MATTRTKDVGVTKTTLAADTYLYGDGNTDGSHKILGSDVANYVASEEGGSTLASLSGGKVPTAQLPWTGETFLGTSTVASLPAPGGLNAGEYYITTDSGTNHSVTFAAGDKAISDGTSYYAVADGVRPIGEGGTGASTAAGARTNLEIDSSDEIAETVTNGQPSLWFDGSADNVTVPDNANLSFTDGTDDLPFSVSAWVKMSSVASFMIAAKDDSTTYREWQFNTSSTGDLRLALLTNGSNYWLVDSTTALTAYADKWVHVAATYSGAASGSFGSAPTNVTLYVNGVAVSDDGGTQTGTYAGMSDTDADLYIGRLGGTYADGEIRNVQVFQSALSAADVETIYRSGVPFELSQATAGGYVSDFTSNSVDGWTPNTYATLDATATVGGDSDNLKIVSDGTASQQHSATISGQGNNSGKAFRMTGEYYLPSGQTAVDGFVIFAGGNGASSNTAFDSLTTDAWTSFEFSGAGTNTSKSISIYLRDGGVTTFNGVSGEYIAFRNIRFVEAGAILDLNAADATISGSNINLPDRSPNGFSGTSSGMSLAANAVNLPAALSANHPNPSSGEALCSLGNNGNEVFKVDDAGNTVMDGDPVITNSTTPASASATGTAGTIAWDADYIYVCTATNTWKRAAISTW